LAIRRDLNVSNTKKRHWPKKETVREASPSWSFKEGDVSWILKKEDLSMVKDVILGVKAYYLYGSTLRRCFTIEGDFLGLKSHDHLNLLRVCILNTWFFFYTIGKNMLCTHSVMVINDVYVYFVVSLSFACAWLCEP
jgi:hypothetical protein